MQNTATKFAPFYVCAPTERCRDF